MFKCEDDARCARINDGWLQAPRFQDARMLGEQCYPIEVDRVNRFTLCPNSTTDISPEAVQVVADENHTSRSTESAS
jgi:hypothetical protein